MTEILMLCGYQGCGKSTYIKQNYPNNPIIISNDILGNKKKSLEELEKVLSNKENDNKQIIIDNTNITSDVRKEFLNVINKYGRKCALTIFQSTIEDCQVRVLHRQYERYQTIFFDRIPEDIKDPGIFPIAALFSARKQYQKPVLEEGFIRIDTVIPVPLDFSDYPNKAVFFDIDGTLRQTEHLKNKYPTKPDEVILLRPKSFMNEIIGQYRKMGYKFFGVSNQSGIAKGIITAEECDRCMDKVKELLEFDDLEIKYCPHQSVPITCYCRKPQSGIGMYFIEKYKVDPKKSIMVGDMTTDKSFATRLGMTFIYSDKFFS